MKRGVFAFSIVIILSFITITGFVAGLSGNESRGIIIQNFDSNYSNYFSFPSPSINSQFIGNISSYSVAEGYIIEFEADPIIKKQVQISSGAGVKTKANTGAQIANYKEDLENSNKETKSLIFEKLEEIRLEEQGLSYSPPEMSWIKKILISLSLTGPELMLSPPEGVEILGDYEAAFNGIALNISKDEAKEIENIEGVKKVYPNYIVKAKMNDVVPLLGVDKLWQLNRSFGLCNGGECLTGKNIKVAVIDTGIDYTHFNLGGCLGVNCKVKGGYDFVNHDNDPMDDQGHGTHVSGIIAGKKISPQQITIPQPVLHYSFDKGNLQDESGNALNGIAAGGVAISNEGIGGKSAKFNGGDGSITIPENSLLNFTNKSFTILYWMKANELNKTQYVFLKGNSLTSNLMMRMGFLQSGYFFGKLNLPDANGQSIETIIGQEVFLNRWNQIGVTVNRSNNNFNLVGQVFGGVSYPMNYQNKNIASTPEININGKFTIGAFNNTPGAGNFNGSIDEFMVFDRVLSDQEIKEIYLNQTGKFVNASGQNPFLSNPLFTGGINGIAPDADLYGYKVLDWGGSGTWDAILSGIEMAVDPNLDGNYSDKADIININLC